MPSDRTEAKKNWLDMHDSIQDELLRLKKEMVASKDDILTEVKRSAYPDQTQGAMTTPAAEPYIPAAPAIAPLKAEEAAKAVEVPEEPDPKRPDNVPTNKATSEPTPQVKERSIREMISTTDVIKEGGSEAETQSALPKHPELTSYIAKVMQHESKIKRKKFEREKSTRPQKNEAPSKEPAEDPPRNDLLVSNPPPIETPQAPPAEPVPEEVVPDEAPPSEPAEKGPEPAPETPPIPADPGPEGSPGSETGPSEPHGLVPDEAPRRKKKKHKHAAESEEKASDPSKKGLMLRIRDFLKGR